MTTASNILPNLMFADTKSVKEPSVKFPEASVRAKDAPFRSVLKDQTSKIRPQDIKKNAAAAVSSKDDTDDEVVIDNARNLAAYLYGMVPAGTPNLALDQVDDFLGENVVAMLNGESGGLFDDGQMKVLENLLNQKAAELLNMNEESFQNMLNEMGMDASDLVDLSQLQKLFMKAEGVTDPMQLIMNEDLSAGFKELNQGIRNALEVGREQLASQWKEDQKADAEMLLAEVLAENIQDSQNMRAGSYQTDKVRMDGQLDNSQAEGDMAMAGAPVVEISDQRMSQSNANTQDNLSSKEQLLSQEASTEDFVPLNQQILNQLSNGVSKASNHFVAPDTLVPQAADIINQMVDRIKLVVRTDMTTMDMELHPESLGKVHIQVADREGVMTAQIAVQSEEARKEVEQNITMLQDTFKNQNLKVDAVEVMVNYQGFDQRSSQEQQGSREQDKALRVGRRRPFTAFQEADPEDTEPDRSSVSWNREDSSVEYMA